jgi:hypothetical protein
MIASAGYDAKARILEIEFLHGGVYHYLDVPEERYRSLIVAPSKGRFFHSQIHGVFRYRRLSSSRRR